MKKFLIAGFGAALWIAAGRQPPTTPLFTDITSRAGIRFRHRASHTSQKYLIETMGSGVAWLDYDGDGSLDLFFVNGAALADPMPRGKTPDKSDPRYWNRLYRNTGHGTFVDVTERAGLKGEGYGMGVAVGDYDNDGRPDLYVTGFGRNHLYHNEGDGTFKDVTDRTGVGGGGWSTGAAFFDYDGDGRLDLIVARYLDWDFDKNIWCGPEKVQERGYCHPNAFQPVTHLLYHNEGNGKFRDVSQASGIAAHPGKGLGVAINDSDGDGRPDILIANDSVAQQLFAITVTALSARWPWTTALPTIPMGRASPAWAWTGTTTTMTAGPMYFLTRFLFRATYFCGMREGNMKMFPMWPASQPSRCRTAAGERSSSITITKKFRFSGREIEGQPGDTIASALYRNGRRIFSRSFKYHRPRGLLCCAGKCPNCMMNVDGIPNVRTCIAPAHEGLEVRHQNAYPSLEMDWLSISQRLDWLMPVGWYYKTFTRQSMWHAAEPWIRKVAGLGEVLPSKASAYEHVGMHAVTAVIGGGAAGIRAALEAADRGEEVVLVDDQRELGGKARYRRSETPRDFIRKLQSLSNVRILSGCYCFGLYEGNLLAVLQPNPHPHASERLIHLRARRVVVATGAYETPLLFPNNDLPGVMLSSAVQRLYRLHGIVPGSRAAIVGDAQRVEEIAADLREAGVAVVASVAPDEMLEAVGNGSLKAIRRRAGSFSCDLIVVCGPFVPDAGLAAQAGVKLVWSEQRGAFLPAELPPNVSVVGDASGETLSPVVTPLPKGRRSFVCICTDVSSKDLCEGISEGLDHIETLKRYTTATMGPCQGRMCQLNAIGICARETGQTVSETGITTSRPPNPSVTLGALAGPRHHSIRRTPMHYAHEELGAVWMDMGDWKRPRYYQTSTISAERECVQEEYRTVREGVGLIDISTLGKLDVRGPDAGRLLDRIYTHRFSDLRLERVRYALMCDEGGVILDDGTISRISQDCYFVTTTTGNLDFVNQWLE